MGIDLSQWRLKIGTFNHNQHVYVQSDSKNKEVLLKQPNNHRKITPFSLCILSLICIYFIAIYPLICNDIETNPGPTSICSHLSDIQRSLFNKIKRTELKLIKHRHHLDFLQIQASQRTVPPGLIPKLVPQTSLNREMGILWHHNTMIYAQSQMNLLIFQHQQTISSIQHDVQLSWHQLSSLCNYDLLSSIQQSISFSCYNLRRELESRKSRKIKKQNSRYRTPVKIRNQTTTLNRISHQHIYNNKTNTYRSFNLHRPNHIYQRIQSNTRSIHNNQPHLFDLSQHSHNVHAHSLPVYHYYPLDSFSVSRTSSPTTLSPVNTPKRKATSAPKQTISFPNHNTTNTSILNTTNNNRYHLQDQIYTTATRDENDTINEEQDTDHRTSDDNNNETSRNNPTTNNPNHSIMKRNLGQN